jgi:hypothetical protein
VFEKAGRRTVTTPTGAEVALHVDLDEARPDTPVAMLGLSPAAADTLDRLGVADVCQLVALPVAEVRFRKGLGGKTRQEILRVRHRLRQRFPGERPAGKPAETSTTEAADPAALDLDALRRRILAGEGSARPTQGSKVAAALLGLVEGATHPPEDWPILAEVAAWLDLSPDEVGKEVAALRDRWANKVPAVTALRNDLVAQVQAAGGVLPLDEAIDALLAARGTTLEDPEGRRRLASALVRAAYETEQAMASPRLHQRRAGRGMLLTLTPELAEYAERLGEVAEAIAAEDPLPSSLRVFQRLYDVPQPDFPPGCLPPNNDRLLRLAAASSASAAVSTRQDLYPRGMSAERALRLGAGAVSALGVGAPERKGDQVTIDQIRDRIAARYPEAEPIPDRPELDRLLEAVGLDFAWDDEAGAYRRPSATDQATSGSSLFQSRPSVPPSQRPPTTPWIAQARQFEERLSYALRDGAFLALTIRPGLMQTCESKLLRDHPELRRVSLDHLLLKHLRRVADGLGIDWPVVLEADGAAPGSEDWLNLLDLVAKVIPTVEAELLGSESPLLLVHPGLLARYDQMGMLERLRDRVGRRGVCPGLWVLVAGDEQSELPLIDGREVPLITSGQRARVPLAWLENAHRATAS